MEFRQLSYFVAVVDTGSISAASRQVHIAQPALTRQIRLLEEDLGTRLLERHPRGVSPTVAGKALYSEAMQLLDTRSRMRTKLSELGQGVIGKVSLGVTVTHLWVPEISMLLRHYRDRYRKVAFEVFPLLSGPQLERLHEGTLDAGILYLDNGLQPGLDTCLLQRDYLMLAVPETSQWARTPPLQLADLKDTDFVWGFRSISPLYYDRVMAHFEHLDFAPRVVQYGADNITILSMVAAGLGVAVVPSASSSNPLPGISFLHLDELADCDMPLWMAWRSNNDSPALRNLVNLVEDMFGTVGA